MGRGTVKDDGGHTSTAHHAPGSRRIAPGEMGGSAGHGKMHLTSAIVKRFKSIDDSEVVRFEPDVTCLVGRNESGKTAFLEALASLNPLADDPLAFDELRDYPRRLRGSEEEIAATVPVSATFELDDADVDDLWGEFGPGVVTSRTVRLDRTYGGRRRLVVEQDDDGRARGGGPALASFVTARVPRFLYFGQYNVLPGRVSIPRLQTLPPTRLAPGERTARSLLRLAGVGADDFVESTYERRKVALEVAAERIGAEVLRYWSQGPDLEVELDVDFRPKGPGGEPGPFLDIRIRDQRHRVTMNFGERSEGFVWFFSFVAAFSEVRETDQLVVLLDEPGLGLHAAAQADLLRYIGERLAPRHQVVYTTHSPFMVDPTAPRRVRTVEDLDRGHQGPGAGRRGASRHAGAAAGGAGQPGGRRGRPRARHPAGVEPRRPGLPGGHERLPARGRPRRSGPPLGAAAGWRPARHPGAGGDAGRAAAGGGAAQPWRRPSRGHRAGRRRPAAAGAAGGPHRGHRHRGGGHRGPVRRGLLPGAAGLVGPARAACQRAAQRRRAGQTGRVRARPADRPLPARPLPADQPGTPAAGDRQGHDQPLRPAV